MLVGSKYRARRGEVQGKFGRSPSLNVWASFIDNASSKKIVSLLPLNPNSQPLEVDIFLF